MSGIRADMVTVFVFRRASGVEFLQLLRAKEPFSGTWHPVAGGIEAGETAAGAALREVHEEAGLAPDDPAVLGFWQLDGVHPFYMHRHDAVMIAPAFAVEVDPLWEPVLNHENSAVRWVAAHDVDAQFMWAGQRASCREVVDLLSPGSVTERAFRIGFSIGSRDGERCGPR